MFGYRHEGRALKKIDPIIALTPYIMTERSDAQVFTHCDLPFDTMSRYITEKGAEGHDLSFMIMVIASFIRIVSQMPQANRFIHNKRMYARTELTCSFVVLQDTKDGSISENTVKCWFDPSDTIFDVEKRVNKIIKEGRAVDADNATMKVAKILLHPALATPVVAIAKVLDRYGIMPSYIVNASPFHTSFFVTNVASIGLPSLHHHIYNFGNTTIFMALGVPEKHVTVKNGQTIRSRTMPMGITIDERAAEGAVYARLMQMMKHNLSHPEVLEVPPEKVFYDEGHEYHCPKVD